MTRRVFTTLRQATVADIASSVLLGVFVYGLMMLWALFP